MILLVHGTFKKPGNCQCYANVLLKNNQDLIGCRNFRSRSFELSVKTNENEIRTKQQTMHQLSNEFFRNIFNLIN